MLGSMRNRDCISYPGVGPCVLIRPAQTFYERIKLGLEHVSSQGSPGGRRSIESPERKRASIPQPQRMAEAGLAFGLSPSEKRTLDLIADHLMIPREHLATWLGVSEGRVSQMMHNLVKTWGLIERHGKRGDVRYTLFGGMMGPVQ